MRPGTLQSPSSRGGAVTRSLGPWNPNSSEKQGLKAAIGASNRPAFGPANKQCKQMQTTQMHAILFKGAGCLERGKPLHTYCNAESRPWKRVANRRAVVAASRHHYRQYNFPVSHRRTAKCSHDITASKVCAYVRWAHPSGMLFCIPRHSFQAKLHFSSHLF